ncbi:MAG: Crp/Fnr family transcriptional regulator [Cyanobacteria bacterium NC_groundwater_1444_Ag_S-0.65um_54_12]|nr:Crp/Fnr family transcriptional regulator [Cyanobacteria bacterium NC_groundwater_1444_Ag_S-0.65um_54_12]
MKEMRTTMLPANSLAFLQRVSIFSGVGQEALARIAAITGEKNYSKRSIIFHEGDAGDTLYILKSGRVKISKITEDGREKTLTIMQPGDFFGEMAIFDSLPRSATAEVIDDQATVFAVNKRDFERIILENPQIALKIMRDLTRRIRQVNQQVEDLAFKDVHERVASTLCSLSKIEGRPLAGSKILINLKMTHQDLANMVGSSRETVTRALNRLQDQEIISISHQQITINRLDLLAAWR